MTTLKLEGRMKSHYYCANTTRIYRQAMDSYKSGNYSYDPQWLVEKTHNFAAFVKEKISDSEVLLEVRERFNTTEPVEIVTPGKENKELILGPVLNTKNKESITLVQANMQVLAKTALKNLDILISSQKFAD